MGGETNLVVPLGRAEEGRLTNGILRYGTVCEIVQDNPDPSSEEEDGKAREQEGFKS